MVDVTLPRFDRSMDVAPLNAREDERLHRASNTILTVLSAPAGFAFGFATFGSALWANIYVDGHDDATFADVVGAIAVPTATFALPAVVLAAIAARRDIRDARHVLAAAAVLPMAALSTYALGALTAGAALSSIWRSVRAGRLRLPAPDATVLVAGLSLMTLWCLLESSR
ncbi:MAG TPA: hypothetical protein VF230_03535 [Acidimicrobiales bacterium]